MKLSGLFKKSIVILPPINIPAAFENKFLHEYSSDSIINILSKLKNETIVEVVGLTHEELYTIKNDAPSPYFDEHIFGIGFLPGNACVVSDNRFKTRDKNLYLTRIKNVILHEMGHNMGLDHCTNPSCIMNPGSFNMLNNDGSDYCEVCRKRLGE
jgi:archaemetzincin